MKHKHKVIGVEEPNRITHFMDMLINSRKYHGLPQDPIELNKEQTEEYLQWLYGHLNPPVDVEGHTHEYLGVDVILDRRDI